MTAEPYDIVFLGHYTKDTIVSPHGTRVVDGGAFNYGAHVAARMGLRVAAVTRLAREDWHVVGELERLAVDCFARATPQSTCLRLEYPTTNLDERVIYVDSFAGAFEPGDVPALQATSVVMGGSLRAEIGLDVIEALRARSRILAADAQGFLRVQRDTKLVHAPWSDTRGVLRQLDVLKTDALEAESLTGQRDMVRAARLLSDRGPREVVITHREGVLALADGIYHEAGFFPERVVGRSGRGDTCLAAYVARRLTHSPEDATAWAAAVTSLKLEAEGPFRRDLRAVESLIRERYQGRGSSLCDS